LHGRHYRRDRRQCGARHPPQNQAFLVARGVRDDELEHKAVHLRFRQRIRPFLLNRVLRRQHQERRVEGYVASPIVT
jgi:hypothetical protein